MENLNFVPKILLCGDEAKFLLRIGDRPFKIVGHAEMSGEVDGKTFDFAQDGKILIDDKFQDIDATMKLLQSDAANYLLFTDITLYHSFKREARKNDFDTDKILSIKKFKNLFSQAPEEKISEPIPAVNSEEKILSLPKKIADDLSNRGDNAAISELNFIPRILLCGDEAEFILRVGNRPYKIISQVKLAGEVVEQSFDFTKDGKIFFNGKLQDLPSLEKFLQSGAVDYFVFNTLKQLNTFKQKNNTNVLGSIRMITTENFKGLPLGFFHNLSAELIIIRDVHKFGIKTLLDIDGYFAKGQVFLNPNKSIAIIEGISNTEPPAITESIYHCVYKNLAQVGFKRYDAVLIAEREPEGFDKMFMFLENYSDKVITFARAHSALEKYLEKNSARFAKIERFGTEAGNWHIITRHKSTDFCSYVITHKATPHDGKLPEGYKMIHAGRILSKDLGYSGDDTGDNISRLNPYINEITAIYWIWKNTKQDFIGTAHYRRFFTEAGNTTFAYDKILTKDAALKILDNYDIITLVLYFHQSITQREAVISTSGEEMTKLGEACIKKYLIQNQPDYLDAFETVMSQPMLFLCNMFVTRRNVFEAYCKWFFSFMLDATEEFLRIVDVEKLSVGSRRTMGYFSERMLTVWLRKNRLKIKELRATFVRGI